MSRYARNPSNPDTIGPEECVLISGVLISGVEKNTNMVIGEEESVLFREVSLFRGVLIEGLHCIACTVSDLD